MRTARRAALLRQKGCQLEISKSASIILNGTNLNRPVSLLLHIRAVKSRCLLPNIGEYAMLGTKVMPMRILALETTDRIGSVAALSGSNPLLQLALHSGQRSAQALAPAVRDLLEQVGWMPDEVELVAVSVGPGSFTGLRVGVTMAKVFAYAVGAEVLGINTLEAIANAGVAKAKTPLAPMREGELSGMVRLTATMDAQRGDIVVQSFTGKLGEFLGKLPV